MNKTIQTYSQIYQDYAQRNVLNDSMIALLDKFISKLSGKKILDIGCAQGRDSVYFAERGYEAFGIDLTPEFIDLAKKNCPTGTFQVMDMQDLKFDDETFDGLWVCASFLHIVKQDAAKILTGFRRVLKKDGRLYLSVMDGDFEGYRKNETLQWDERYFSHYTKEELQDLLIQNGFQIEDFMESSTNWGPKFLNFFCALV